MDDLSAKIMSMVLLGVVSLILGMIPVPIVRKLRWGPDGDGMSVTAKAILSGLLCFGGGVLMATAFLHLLPEVHEGFEAWHHAELLGTTLPLGEICVCVGFFMVYFVEELVHYFSDKHAHHQTDVSVHKAVSVRACSISREGPAPPCDALDTEECPEETICKLDCLDKEFCKDVVPQDGEQQQTSSAAGSAETLIVHVVDDNCHDLASRKVRYAKKSNAEKYGTFDDHKHDEHADHGHQDQGVRKSGAKGKHRKHSHNFGKTSHNKSGINDFGSLHNHGHHGHSSHHHHGLPTGKHKVGAAMRGLLVIIALSLHEVFEGMAVGLQGETTHVLQMFAAVASHKFVISLCVGLELCSSGVKLLVHTTYILVFSIVTPLGIGIGIALTSMTHSDHEEEGLTSIVVLVLQGLACGTLLYVAFFEILERERSKSTSGIVLLALLLLGFLVMLGLEALGGHDHGHDHEDEVVTTMATVNVTVAP